MPKALGIGLGLGLNGPGPSINNINNHDNVGISLAPSDVLGSTSHPSRPSCGASVGSPLATHTNTRGA